MVLTLNICEFNGLYFGMINKINFCNNELIIFQCFKLNATIFNSHYHFAFAYSNKLLIKRNDDGLSSL